MEKIQEKIDTAFNAAGGLGLFFSFTEVQTRAFIREMLTPAGRLRLWMFFGFSIAV